MPMLKSGSYLASLGQKRHPSHPLGQQRPRRKATNMAWRNSSGQVEQFFTPSSSTTGVLAAGSFADSFLGEGPCARSCPFSFGEMINVTNLTRLFWRGSA